MWRFNHRIITRGNASRHFNETLHPQNVSFSQVMYFFLDQLYLLKKISIAIKSSKFSNLFPVTIMGRKYRARKKTSHAGQHVENEHINYKKCHRKHSNERQQQKQMKQGETKPTESMPFTNISKTNSKMKFKIAKLC